MLLSEINSGDPLLEKLYGEYTHGARTNTKIFVNPGRSEFKMLLTNCRSLRGLLTRDKLFVWDALSAIHYQVSKYLESNGEDMEGRMELAFDDPATFDPPKEHIIIISNVNSHFLKTNPVLSRTFRGTEVIFWKSAGEETYKF